MQWKYFTSVKLKFNTVSVVYTPMNLILLELQIETAPPQLFEPTTLAPSSYLELILLCVHYEGPTALGIALSADLLRSHTLQVTRVIHHLQVLSIVFVLVSCTN